MYSFYHIRYQYLAQNKKSIDAQNEKQKSRLYYAMILLTFYYWTSWFHENFKNFQIWFSTKEPHLHEYLPQKAWKKASKTSSLSNEIWKLSTVAMKITSCQRYTNADLKISLYVCVHKKKIPWKFCILNSKNSRVICSSSF